MVGLGQVAFVAFCFLFGDGVGRAAPEDGPATFAVQCVTRRCVADQGASLCIGSDNKYYVNQS